MKNYPKEKSKEHAMAGVPGDNFHNQLDGYIYS